MVKKLFALASVTALTGLVSAISAAGCSSTEVTTSTTDAGTDAGSKKSDSGVPVVGDAEEPVEPTCAVTKPIDVSDIPFKPPIVDPGACTTDDQAFIVKTIKENNNITLAELKEAIEGRSAGCASCVFAPDGDKWAPIVELDDGKVIFNYGSCFAIASGKDSCGKAYFGWDLCITQACDKCTDDEMGDCASEVQAEDGACGDATKALQEECGNNISAYIKACSGGSYKIEPPIVAQCIGLKTTTKDAGTDSGKDAN